MGGLLGLGAAGCQRAADTHVRAHTHAHTRACPALPHTLPTAVRRLKGANLINSKHLKCSGNQMRPDTSAMS